MVIAGHDADPEWVALDLCAQAEHGAESPLVVAAVEEHVLDAIAAAAESAAADAPQRRRRAAGAGPGARHSSAAIDLANAFAPEHLELIEEDAALLADRVTTAGCVFVGRYGATAFGDYVAGSNHVLPTGGAGPLLGPARARHFPPQDLHGRDSRRGGGEAGPARRHDRPRRGLPRPRRVRDD